MIDFDDDDQSATHSQSVSQSVSHSRVLDVHPSQSVVITADQFRPRKIRGESLEKDRSHVEKVN